MTAELEKIEVALGPDHIDTAKVKAGLGCLSFILGNLDQAEELADRMSVIPPPSAQSR